MAMDEVTSNEPAAAGERTPRHTVRRLAIRLGRWALILAVLLLVLRLTGCMERLFYIPTSGPTPPPDSPPGVEKVFFESADGTRLCGWFIPAQVASNDDASAPTILHVHGNAGNMESHQFFTEHLPPAGYNVFLFDYRGYGESEGTPRRRRALIDDTHAALDYILQREDVDRQRIGLYGQSLGGSIALNVMADRKSVV